MSTLSALVEGTNDIDFRPLWKRTLPASVIVSVVALLIIVFLGLNLSIEFDGGGIFEVPVADSVTVADGRAVIADPDAQIQSVTDLDGSRFIRVQTSSDALDQADEIVAALAGLGGVSADEVSVNTVGPKWGDEITRRAVRALIFFFIVVALYLAWTLEWAMAVGALAAVVHDLLLTAGAYALFRFEVSPATVIALLTIMGYSLYDTVVVYDKVKENRPLAAKQGQTGMINKSMNQVILRSINTTVTTVLPVASMLVIGSFFLGGSTIRGFALALFIGLLAGTYSSIFLAAPLLAWMKERGIGVAKA